MIFAAGFVIALIFSVWYILTEGSVSGFFACVGFLMMLVSVLIYAGKHLP